MAQNLRLADLLPEQDTFTDRDNATYPMRSVADFTPHDVATIERTQRKLAALQHMSAPKTQDEQIKRFSEINGVLADLLRFIIPDMPQRRALEIHPREKQKIFAWWQERQPKQEAPAAPTGGHRGEPWRGGNGNGGKRSRRHR